MGLGKSTLESLAGPAMITQSCRFCDTPLTHSFANLGHTPLANSYLTAGQLSLIEPQYPLHARLCVECMLVQVESVVPAAEIFGDYAYFSSYSTSWVEHARQYTQHAIKHLNLTSDSYVIEIASNDGYLLRHFVDAQIPCMGVEPAANVAKKALELGVPTEVSFFGLETAKRLSQKEGKADLLIANNVLAHVPDLNDFIAGLAYLLKPSGTLTIEFPHLLQLISQTQFDTIYHEHYCYFSLVSLDRIFARHGLKIFDVTPLSTHGGSLRIWVNHDYHAPSDSKTLQQLRRMEQAMQLHIPRGYDGFQENIQAVCNGLNKFLKHARSEGKTVVAYGAAAKGNTLLNVCGLTSQDIPYVVDKSPYKQGYFLPGSHLPIYSPNKIMETQPDYVLLLPWNLRTEIADEMQGIRQWGGQFVVAVPKLEIF